MNLQKNDKDLAQIIIDVYQGQKSYDNSVVIVFEVPNILTVGNKRISLAKTTTVRTLFNRLHRIKGAGMINAFEKQGSSKVIKVLMREIRNQKAKKITRIKQLQLQLS